MLSTSDHPQWAARDRLLGALPMLTAPRVRHGMVLEETTWAAAERVETRNLTLTVAAEELDESEVDVMKQVVLELSDDLARQVGAYQGRLQELVLLGLSQLKAQEALTLYTRGIVSFARAAEIAGLSRPEMIRQARALGIRPRWSEQMVEEELA